MIRNKRLTSTLLAATVASAVLLSVGAAAAMATPPGPTVRIGSTTGPGPSGCVWKTKTVLFKVAAEASSGWPSSARVSLDGRTIATKTWPEPVGFKPSEVAAGPAAVPSFSSRFFSVVVNLSAKAPGRHLLKLTGTTTYYPSFRPRATADLTTSASTTKPIVKCATFTG